jgi:NAD(P)-dependent dehydrogenase (short-subunit alcohol dehydrogenase family)
MTLTGKTALITGANSGIGLATCLLFAKEKCEIIALDINSEISPELKLKLSTLGAKFEYISCDVADNNKVMTMAEKLKSRKLDILVNNAGILGPRKKITEYPTDDFDRVIDINIKGVYYIMKAILPIFIAHNAGAIVNTASVAGHVGMAGHIAYSASKHAVMGMTKTVALEVAKNNIRVNAVCPGFTETAMLTTNEMEQQYLDMLKYVTPMKRFGQASEIATAILYMASEASSFMTGQCIILDGGLTAQ